MPYITDTISRMIDEAQRGGSGSHAPLYVPTIDLGGSIHAAPGVRTGLATTQHSVTAGDGTTASQGFTAENIATGVTGTKGAFTLTVTDTAKLATLDGDGSKVWDAAILNSDGRAFTATVLDVSGGTVSLLRPLPFNVTGGRLASRIDAVLGQHLTTIGYKALAQHIAAADPLVGTRGGIIEGEWDTLPASARTIWARNAALIAYGAPVVDGVTANMFEQGPANQYDTPGLYRRSTPVGAGVQIGTHLTGHGGIATLRTGRHAVVIEVAVNSYKAGVVLPAARIRLTVKTPEGHTLYDETQGGGMTIHRIPVPAGFDSVTVEATNADGADEFYIELSQTTVRIAGNGGKLAPAKALLLGDSWTQFYGHQLGADLAAAMGSEVVTFGKGGTTTDWGIAWLDYALAANPGCDAVILHFYTNDLNNNQGTTMTLPDGSTAAMWPNGLTTDQARARWVAQIARLVSMIQQRGMRPVVVMPGMVNITAQFEGHNDCEFPPLIEWSAASAEFTSAASYLNTVGKKAGKVALDTTLGKPLWASGATPTATWKDATGTVAHTPA